MVGMPPLPIRQDHGSRPQRPDSPRDGQLVFHLHLQVRIGKAQVLAMRDAQDARRGGSLLPAHLHRAASAHLSSGQIQDSHGIAAVGHLDQRAAAGEFRVIGMCGYRQQIQFHCAS